MKAMLDLISRMGNARHKNLTRLLGCCYNKRMAYLLCDYLPNGNLAERIRTKRDWVTKHKIIVAIAKGLYFLHHECYPAIPHGDLKTNNIMFDENMEPHLTEFGVRFLIQLNNGPSVARVGNESGMHLYFLVEDVVCILMFVKYSDRSDLRRRKKKGSSVHKTF